MSTTHTTSGIQVTEYDEPDTLDVTLSDPDAEQRQQWETVFASGRSCVGCLWHEIERGHRECAAEGPMDCPAVNPRSVANALRRQAS